MARGDDFQDFVETLERHVDAAAVKMARLSKSFYACPSRDDGGPHLPRFGPNTVEMHCTYCGEPLVAI